MRDALWTLICLKASRGLRVVAIVAVSAGVSCLQLAATEGEFLSDRPELIRSATVGWGKLGFDVTARGELITMAGRTFAKGIGHHANGEILVMLDGRFSHFEAEVGLQTHPSGAGSVIFRIFVDKRKAFDSGVMRQGDGVKSVQVSVAGARELRLEMDDAGDGFTRDMGNWGNARLNAQPGSTPPEPVNIAPFARVVSWDPNRMDGARASRIEEFHEEDLFLETDNEPGADGSYPIEVTDGVGCIGLQWLNRWPLSELRLELTAESARPAVESVEVQGWFGESAWQGEWKALEGELAVSAGKFSFQLTPVAGRVPVQKIRWIFPVAERVTVRKLAATSRARWDVVRLVAEIENAVPDTRGELTVYGGELEEGSLTKEWNLEEPLEVTIRYGHPSVVKSEPTILHFRTPSAAFAVSVEDILANGSVYLPRRDFYVSTESARTSMAEYRQEIAGRRTLLEEVRNLPDQTLEQAMAKTHNPVQANGPVMLSLAGDNVKFVVERGGLLFFDSADDPRVEPFNPPISVGGQELRFARTGEMQPRFGTGRHRRVETGGGVGHFAALAAKPPDASVTRSLDGGWLPIPVTMLEEDGVQYSQRTFVAPSGSAEGSGTRWNRSSVCVAQFTILNTREEAAEAILALDFLVDSRTKEPAGLMPDGRGLWVVKERGAMAWLDTSRSGDLRVRGADGTVTFSGKLPAGETATVSVYFPGTDFPAEELDSFENPVFLREAVEEYWREMLAPGMQLELPDERLENVVRCSVVRCMIAARNEADGARLAPWISAMRYGPLESEAHAIIRAMDLMGHADFARDGLEYFIHRYTAEGFLTTGYTTFGTAWHLWTLADHHRLNPDRDWLGQVAPEVVRVGEWIVRQLEKTRKMDTLDRPFPEYGLMPPGVMADWNSFGYHFMMNAYYHAGLREIGRVLTDLGRPEGTVFLRKSEDLRENLLRAYRWTQAQTPVLPLRDGTWVEPYPSRVHSPGKLEDFFPGEDMGRSWCYDVELGAHQMVVAGVVEADEPEVGRMLGHMEDVQFLGGGWYDYSPERSDADWFNLGGFSKVQPYYTRNAEIYAMRQDSKPFLRSYFNSLASLLNPEVLTLWEHFHNRAAWDKTHETAYFLKQTRAMLVAEAGDDLWLASMIPSEWLEDGKMFSVKNAPTVFGAIDYRVKSHVTSGFIEATIDLSARGAPRTIVLRLRHPDGRPIKGATINGTAITRIDGAQETISFEPRLSGPMRVRVDY